MEAARLARGLLLDPSLARNCPFTTVSLMQQQPSDLIVISRYRVLAREQFAIDARRALTVLAESDGFVDGMIGQSTDETDLLAIVTRWTTVGAYRRALGRFEVKTEVVPLLSTAVDESSAFEVVHERSGDQVRDASSRRAADADWANVGTAAADVPPVVT
jgi:hypothetical protein